MRRDLRVQIAAAQAIEPGDGDALPERVVLFPGDPLEAATDGRRHVVTDAAEVVAETLRHAPSDGRRPVTFDHAGLVLRWLFGAGRRLALRIPGGERRCDQRGGGLDAARSARAR